MPSLPDIFIAPLHRIFTRWRISRAARNWPKAALTTRPPLTRICVAGFFAETLGIGRAAELSAKTFEANGHVVIRDDLRPLHRRLLTRKPMPFPENTPVWFIHANPPEARIALFTRDPKAWANMYRIGYWVWESSLAPREWLDVAQWFHEIWVPSAFVQTAFAEAFVAAGLTDQVTKLKVMPHPVPIKAVPPRTGSRMRALCLFDPRSDLERKNPHAVLTAWMRAFETPLVDACLIMKTHSGADQAAPFATLLNLAKGRQDIVFQCETLSDLENARLIETSDLLISLHRAEGFGLVMAEAMAAGVPVMATGWSGNRVFMDETRAALIPYRLVAANRRHNGPQAQWAEPDIAAAAQSLRTLYADPEARRALGLRGRDTVAALQAPWRDV